MSNEKNIKLASHVAIIAGIFTLLIAMLFLINYINIKQNDPVENRALESLVERLSDDRNNEALIEEIRYLDLLARKAYFTGQWQIDVGSWLMLIGAFITAFSLRVYFSLTGKIDEPQDGKLKAPVARVISQKWVSALAALIVVMALFASFGSRDYLERYAVLSLVEDEPSETIANDIVVVDVKKDANPEPFKETAPEEPIVENTPAVVEVVKKEEPKAEVLKAEKPLAQVFPTIEEQKKQFNAFRGFWGQGIAYAKNVLTEWDGTSGKNIKWKTELPLNGFSSPVIWNNYIFLTGADNTRRVVFAFDRLSGNLLWQHVADNIAGSPATPPKTTDDTGLAAPSVTTDGQRVYALFGTGDVLALTVEGERVWAKNLGVPDNHYGHSSSLLFHKNKLFVQYDTNKGGRVLALDVFDGSVVWDTQRSGSISWASPVLAELDGKIQLILTADPNVAAYGIENGVELWSVSCMMGEVGPSVGVGDGLVFAGNEYATLAAIDAKTAEIVWEDNEFLPEVSSPLYVDGLLYIATTYGVFVCYDGKTGDKKWEMEFDNGFYSSPMFVDGKIYIVDTEGIVHVLKAGEEAEKISENMMGEPIMSTPAFTDGMIYLRSESTLYCIGE